MSIKEVLRNPKFIVGAASAFAAASGGVGGYIYARKRLIAEFEELSEREIANAKEYYEKHFKVGRYADPVEMAKDLAEEDVNDDALQELSLTEAAREIAENSGYVNYSDISEQSTEEKVVVEASITNVFLANDPIDGLGDYDPAAEEEKKRAGLPYVVDHDTFFENEQGYAQTQTDWFVGDQTLADEQSMPVNDLRVIGGTANLRFGCGSKDANIVYIANDKIRGMFEVTKTEGKYSEEVLGEIAHSDRSDRGTLRRFRPGYDG